MIFLLIIWITIKVVLVLDLILYQGNSVLCFISTKIQVLETFKMCKMCKFQQLDKNLSNWMYGVQGMVNNFNSDCHIKSFPIK